MRLTLGLAIPIVLLITGYLQRDAGQWVMTGGLYFIAGLLIVGSLSGALLRSTWAILYVTCVLIVLMALTVIFEIGGVSLGGAEDRVLLVSGIAMYAAFGGFGAAVGVESTRRDILRRG